MIMSMKHVDSPYSQVFNTEQISCICDTLYQCQDGQKLIRFFSSDPNILKYHRTASVVMAYLQALFHAGKFEDLTDQIKNTCFEEKLYDDLRQLWYNTKYAEDERRKKKPLGPVEKYRLRKKFPPPMSIWDGDDIVYSFREKDRTTLKKYYNSNKYPNPTEKKAIAERTGLKIVQISNWFKNRRQRDKTSSDSSISPKMYSIPGF